MQKQTSPRLIMQLSRKSIGSLRDDSAPDNKYRPHGESEGDLTPSKSMAPPLALPMTKPVTAQVTLQMRPYADPASDQKHRQQQLNESQPDGQEGTGTMRGMGYYPVNLQQVFQMVACDLKYTHPDGESTDHKKYQSGDDRKA